MQTGRFRRDRAAKRMTDHEPASLRETRRFLPRPGVRPGTKQTGAELLYDSRDLTTHAVCIGMTGSGKTGLCLSLLEEAALDGIPAIAIDPKGDIANLALTFPRLQAQDFRPWVDAGRSRAQGPDDR